MSWIRWQPMTEIVAEYCFCVESTISIMCMADANGNAFFLGDTKRKIATLFQMGMDDSVLRMSTQEIAKIFFIFIELAWVHRAHAIDPTTQRSDLILVCSDLFAIYEKIKLNFSTIHVSVIVHNHGFCTTAVQAGDEIEHPFHARIPFAYYAFGCEEICRYHCCKS